MHFLWLIYSLKALLPTAYAFPGIDEAKQRQRSKKCQKRDEILQHEMTKRKTFSMVWEKEGQVHSKGIEKKEKSMIDERGSETGSDRKQEHRTLKSTSPLRRLKSQSRTQILSVSGTHKCII